MCSIFSQDSELLCDGVPDCGDWSDEAGCELCREQQWLCPLAMENGARQPQCIEEGDRCDGPTSCSWGEDERHCVALARQGELVLAGDGTPLDREEGSLVVYQSGRWAPVCTSTFSSTLMHQLCRYMGWPRGLYKSLVDKSATGLQVIEEDGAVFAKARSSDQECSHVSLACDPAVCGVRTLYGGLEEDQVYFTSGIVLVVVIVLFVLFLNFLIPGGSRHGGSSLAMASKLLRGRRADVRGNPGPPQLRAH